MNVYTVHAFRWADRERHSYIVGVYSTEALALQASKTEELYRGGKYYCEVLEWTVDCGFEGRDYEPKVVQELPDRGF